MVRTFEMVDLAADYVPVARLRRARAAIKQQLAVAQDGKPGADARKIPARHGLT
jgi:hypothetical protein